MATQGFEIPTEFRDFAEKGVAQARNAVSTLISGALKTSEQLQTTGSNVQSTMHAVVLKGLDHAQANATATFDFTSKLVKARDFREAVELQSEYVKSQFAAMQTQVKEYGSLVQKAA